jgi:DNA polymerase
MSLSKEEKFEALKKIRDELLNFEASPLYAERVLNKAFPVIGEGDHSAQIMFVGEAPGKNEAMTGKPFCGMSGKILDQLFEHIKMSRKDVYITNLVKDRPTNNRDPKPDELSLLRHDGLLHAQRRTRRGERRVDDVLCQLDVHSARHRQWCL